VKYIVKFLALLLSLLMLVIPLAGCASHKRPLAYLKASLERTVRQSVLGEMLSLVLAALDEGAIDLSVSGAHTLGGATALDLSLFFNGDDEEIMADAALSAGDKSFDGKLWFSGDHAVLTSNTFLGSTTLGLDFNTLKNDIAHSIFKNNSGTDYAVPEINDGTASAILSWVDGFYQLFGTLDDMPDLLDKYVDVFLKNLTKYASFTRYKEKGKVKIYLSVDNSMLSRALRDTWAVAVKDKSLSRQVREVAKTRDAMQSAVDGVVSTVWSNKVEAWLVNDAEIEALCAKIDAAAPFTFELNATVKKLTGKLLYLDFTHRSGEDETAFSLDIGEKDALELVLLLDGVKRSLSVKTEESGWRALVADYTYKTAKGEAEPDVITGTFDLDKKQDAYTLTLGKNGVVKTVNGSFSCKNDAFVFSVDGIKTGDVPTDFKLSLTVKEDAEMPTTPPYVNLVTVTEQRIAPVAERAKGAKDAFLAAVDRTALTKENVMAYFLAPFSFEQ